MPVAELSLIKRYDEFLPLEAMRKIPANTRGIYALLKKKGNAYNVIYVGMAGGDKTGIHGRLNAHARSKRKKDKWSHFSLFEVHDNVSRAVIQELEGLLRHIYRRDQQALEFNRQRRFKKLTKVHERLENWN